MSLRPTHTDAPPPSERSRRLSAPEPYQRPQQPKEDSRPPKIDVNVRVENALIQSMSRYYKESNVSGTQIGFVIDTVRVQVDLLFNLGLLDRASVWRINDALKTHQSTRIAEFGADAPIDNYDASPIKRSGPVRRTNSSVLENVLDGVPVESGISCATGTFRNIAGLSAYDELNSPERYSDEFDAHIRAYVLELPTNPQRKLGLLLAAAGIAMGVPPIGVVAAAGAFTGFSSLFTVRAWDNARYQIGTAALGLAPILGGETLGTLWRNQMAIETLREGNLIRWTLKKILLSKASTTAVPAGWAGAVALAAGGLTISYLMYDMYYVKWADKYCGLFSRDTSRALIATGQRDGPIVTTYMARWFPPVPDDAKIDWPNSVRIVGNAENRFPDNCERAKFLNTILEAVKTAKRNMELHGWTDDYLKPLAAFEEANDSLDLTSTGIPNGSPRKVLLERALTLVGDIIARVRKVPILQLQTLNDVRVFVRTFPLQNLSTKADRQRTSTLTPNPIPNLTQCGN